MLKNDYELHTFDTYYVKFQQLDQIFIPIPFSINLKMYQKLAIQNNTPVLKIYSVEYSQLHNSNFL